ncbi:MAG TPA: DUF3892 domain-containing protein [Acidimicrobiales bacterium]|nr:DUF3892 domain-containing protein [Acidimicrobiales bacterium]
MADYKVVCVERKPAAGHHHIIGVGVVRGGRPLEHKTVKDVRRAIKAKEHTFYTVDGPTGEKVPVIRHKCCGEKTICSVTDGTKADNLAALSSCNRLTWYMTR